MDPLEGLSRREWRRVLRVAARMRRREQEQEDAGRLRQEYVRAAAEVGLSEECLRRAAHQVRERSLWRLLVGPAGRAVLVAGLLAATGGLWSARQLSTPPELAMPAPEPPVPEPQLPPAPPASEPAAAIPAEPMLTAPSAYRVAASGLKIAVLRQGTGPAARAGQSLTVHYTGWLAGSSKKIDSSLDHGAPFAFTVGAGQTIAGWEEGLKGMRAGEIRQLVIPPDLGYGAPGVPGGGIPPDSTLIFCVQAVRIGE